MILVIKSYIIVSSSNTYSDVPDIHELTVLLALKTTIIIPTQFLFKFYFSWIFERHMKDYAPANNQDGTCIERAQFDGA